MAGPDIVPLLYYFPGSFYSQKVLLALKEKHVPFRHQLVSTIGGDIYSPWFLSINPKGQIPVLEHGNTRITDSKTITEYIEDNFDGPPLFPSKSSEAYAKVQELITRIDSIRVVVLSYGTVLVAPDLVTNPQIPEFLRKKMKGAPTRMRKLLEDNLSKCEKGSTLYTSCEEKLENLPFDMTREMVEAAVAHTEDVLDDLEKHLELMSPLSTGPVSWLVDNTFTAADIALAVALQRFFLVGLTTRFLSKRPMLTAYYERLKAEKPNFVEVCVNMGFRALILKQTLTYILPVLLPIAVIGIGIGIWYYHKKN